MRSDIEPEIVDIPFLHEIVLPLDGDESFVPSRGLGTEPDDIVRLDDFDQNKAFQRGRPSCALFPSRRKSSFRSSKSGSAFAQRD